MKMVHGYFKNILIIVLILLAAGTNISYSHGDFEWKYMGMTDLLEILKDGIGTAIATVIGWIWMRNPTNPN